MCRDSGQPRCGKLVKLLCRSGMREVATHKLLTRVEYYYNSAMTYEAIPLQVPRLIIGFNLLKVDVSLNYPISQCSRTGQQFSAEGDVRGIVLHE